LAAFSALAAADVAAADLISELLSCLLALVVVVVTAVGAAVLVLPPVAAIDVLAVVPCSAAALIGLRNSCACLSSSALCAAFCCARYEVPEEPADGAAAEVELLGGAAGLT